MTMIKSLHNIHNFSLFNEQNTKSMAHTDLTGGNLPKSSPKSSFFFHINSIKWQSNLKQNPPTSFYNTEVHFSLWDKISQHIILDYNTHRVINIPHTRQSNNHCTIYPVKENRKVMTIML